MAHFSSIIRKDPIRDAPAAARMMMRAGTQRNQETLFMACLDSEAQLLALQSYASASHHYVVGDMRDLVVAALGYGARSVILGHNHPSGDLSPSRADLETTRDLRRIFRLLSIRLQDHIIFSGNQWSSMRALGLI